MKRLLKWIGLTAAIVVIVMLAAAVILPLVFDPNDHKARIEEQASAALGRAVRLEGPIGWSVFPWLAIDLSDVTVANESGFQEALLMRVTQASARVRVMPLLRREIEIGTIALDAPQINLEVTSRGRNNWDSIGQAGGDAEDGGAFGGKLVVAGVRVDRGRVNYVDRAEGVEARFSDLRLSTGEIAPGAPVEAGLDFDLELPASGFSGSVSTRATVRGLLADSPLSIVVEKLDVSGLAGRVPLRLELDEPAELDAGADTLSAPAVVIESAGAVLRGDVTARNLSTTASLSGRVEVDEFDARRWLAESFQADPQSADPDALRAVSLGADWSVAGDRADLENLVAKLDDTTLRGKVNLSSIENLRGRFALEVDRIDLDRYLPPQETDAAADEELLAGLEFGNLTGEIAVDELKFAGLTASKLNVTVKSGSQGVDFDPITADFYGGRLASGFALRPGAARQTVTLRQDLNGVQAGPLFEDLLGRKVLTGLGNLSADVALDSPRAANPLASANGTLEYRFNDGQLFGINVFAIARKALTLIGRAPEPAEDEPEGEPATDFSTMVLKARIVDGVLDTRELRLVSPVLEMSGQVKLDLSDRSLRGTIEPTMLAAGAKAHGLDLGQLAGVPLPVSLSGTYDAPSIGLDPAKLLLASQRGKLDDKKAALLDRLGLGESETADAAPAEKDAPAETADSSGEDDAKESEKKESSKERVARGLLDSLLKKDEDEEDTGAETDDRDSG